MNAEPPVGVSRTLVLRRHPEEVSCLQSLVREIAAQTGFPQGRTGEVLAAVSEAVSVAVERVRGEGDIKVLLDAKPALLHVEVRVTPRFQAGELRHSGLPLMAALADELRFRSTKEGTTVSFLFRRDGRSASLE
jgi:anti-sigma regulatory factor (Ser/Thr protein kinase)